jgi:hypothetical protein
VQCLIASIRSAHQSGRLNDRQASELVGAMNRALGVAINPVFELEAGKVPNTVLPITAKPGDRITSRSVGPDTYCTEVLRRDGSIVVGIVDGRGRKGDWIEVSSDRATATIITWHNGRQESRSDVQAKTLRRDRKHKFAYRASYSNPGMSGFAHGRGATLYVDKADPKRITFYYGSYRQGQRHGSGCYFGAIAVQPYCYRNDVRVAVPTDRTGVSNLMLCRGA